MSDSTFRRIVWSITLVIGILVWTFAIIGVRAMIANPHILSVWNSAGKLFP